MKLMQFAAVVLLTLMLLKLLLLPRKVAVNPLVGTARWLMVAGIALLDVQFLLQYSLGLRAMGVTQAVLVNLVLFIPSSWTISLAVLYLQQQGFVNLRDKLIGGGVWGVVLLLLGGATAIDEQPLLCDSPELHWAEIIASLFYLAMQGHYSARQWLNIRNIHRTLQDYYDRDMDDMLLWMQLSILVLMVMTIMVPLLIFVDSEVLAIFGLLFFVGIFFLTDSFCNYMVSSSSKKMQEAEEHKKKDLNKQSSNQEAPDGNNDESPAGNDVEATTEALLPPSPSMREAEDEALEDEALEGEAPEGEAPGTEVPRNEVVVDSIVCHAIERWIDRGGYRRNGITMPAAADEIGIPRYLLSAWLRQRGSSYANWMTELRIDKAKQIIMEHRDWNNEAIASHCGFSDRTYFQKKFKERTGLSPSDYATTA